MMIYENENISIENKISKTSELENLLLSNGVAGFVSEYCLIVSEKSSTNNNKFYLCIAEQNDNTEQADMETFEGSIEEVLERINEKLPQESLLDECYEVKLNPKIRFLDITEKYYVILSNLVIFRCTICKDLKCENKLY